MTRRCRDSQKRQHERRYRLLKVQLSRSSCVSIAKTLRYDCDECAKLAIDDGVEDIVLVTEMIMDEALTNTCLCRDVPQRGALIPMPGKENFGGIENSLSGLSAFEGITFSHIALA